MGQKHQDIFQQPWLKPISWQLAHGKSLELGKFGHIMGVLNVTPDSFSDGGEFITQNAALNQVAKMIGEGASIIDVGGESTRPGSAPITGEIERQRILPIITAILENFDVLISVDTYRAETANAALKAGAHIINDVWGLQREAEIANVAKQYGAGLCIMHTGRERQILPDVIEDQFAFFKASLEIAKTYGIENEHIILDPGFGFAKNPQQNLQLLARLEALHDLGFPLLIGTSRKRFLGALMQNDQENRDCITAVSSIAARLKGGAIFRVHDVKQNAEAIALADGILHCDNLENLPKTVALGKA